jgi:hypothetical protein
LGLYNDTRDVAFTRPSIILPQSIYFERTRDLALSADGGILYGEHRADWGNIAVDFGVWAPIVGDKDTKLSVVGQSAAGELQPDVSYIGRILYGYDNDRIKLGITGILLNTHYAPASPPVLGDTGPGKIEFQPWYFSAQYNAETWSLTSEYAIRNFDLRDFGNPILDRAFVGESYYFQGTYRLTDNLEAMARYDAYFVDRDDRDGTKFARQVKQLTGLNRPTFSRFAKDWAIGLRYNITPQLMVRGEYHWIDGTGWLPLQDNPDPNATERDWDMFALQVSFRF